MTDSFVPSEFVGASGFIAPSQFVDDNLDAIELVERSWRLPALPDLVKLDLVSSPHSTPESLTQTLTGIDESLHRPTADDVDEPEPLTPRQSLSGLDQTRVVLASLASQPPPQRVADDAVERFKLRAIDAGLLDAPSGRVDAAWSPELNRIAGELAWDDYNRSLRGGRPGAVPFSRAVQVLGDLTSPAGLLSFATDLDLFWDFGAIGDEISSWDDKWRKLADEGLSKGPLNFAKNFVDALTGPIDDIAFPIINVGLMFTGFGAVTNAARVGWMGRNLARAGNTFGRLYGQSRVGRGFASGLRGIGEGFEAGARMNLAELSRPSMLAEGLRRGTRSPTLIGTVAGAGVGALADREDPLRGAAIGGLAGFGASGAVRGTRFARKQGDLLAQWRGLAPVVQSKRVVQQGMRLGLASYAEDAFPGYQGGGFELSDLPGVSGVADRLYQAGFDPRFLPLELMFAPYNVFAPGTFFRRAGQGTALAGRTGRGVARALGTTPGRATAGAAAGAVGGAIAGEDAGDIAKGAAIGAGGAAALPAVGRALEVQRIHQGLTGALAGAAGGFVLGDSPEDVALGALAGTGTVFLPNTVRRRVYNQVGVSGLDRLIRGIGHTMVRTNYQLVEADADIAMGFHRKMRRLLTDAPDELRQWDTDVNSYGVVGALAKRSYGKVDDDTRNMVASAIAFDYTTFALDWIAHAQSTAVQGARRQKHAFHMARNKLTNQLRPVDLDQPTDRLIEDLAKIIAWTDTRGGGTAVTDLGRVPRLVDQQGDALFKVRRRQREVVAELRKNPERAVTLAEEHNRQIGDTINQLFEQRNFPDVEDFTPGTPRGQTNLFGADWAGMDMSARSALYANHGGWENFGDFREFTQVTDEIRRARRDGIFDAATLKPVRTRRGRQRAPKAGAGVDFFDPASRKAQQAVSDMIVGRTQGGRFDELVEEALGGGRFGIDSDSRIGRRLSSLSVDEEDSIKSAVRSRLESGEDITAAEATIEELTRRGHLDDLAPEVPPTRPGIDVERLGNLKVTPWAAAHEAGRVTPARLDFVAKQQIEEMADRVADVLSLQRIMPKLARDWERSEALRRNLREGTLGEAVEIGEAAAAEMSRAEMRLTLQALIDAGVKRGSAKQLLSFARHHELTLADLAAGVNRIGDELLDTTDWTRYGFGNIVTNSEGRMLTGTDALGARLRELRDKAPFTAAELDMDNLARYYDEVDAPVVKDHTDFAYLDDQAPKDWAAGQGSRLLGAKGIREAMDRFDSLPDDAVLTVYHGTSRANAESILAGRRIDPKKVGTTTKARGPQPGDLYVAPTPEAARMYANIAEDGETILAIQVRKGDLHRAPESGDLSPSEAFFDPVTDGLVVRDPSTWQSVEIHARRAPQGRPAAKATRSVRGDRVRDLAREAEARGYKYVHGVEFLMAEDVAFSMPTFADATRRHQNAVTLGNWFGRRQPIEAWARDDRRRRLVLAEELSRVGRNVDPGSREADNILSTLERWLKHDQDNATDALRLAHKQGGIGEKVTTRVRSSLVPLRLDDVGGFSRRQKAIIDEMDAIGYSEDEAAAIWKAVSRFRQSDFAEVGLYGVEAEMRNRSQAAGFLKMLGGSRYGNSVIGRMAGQAATGAAIGAVAAGGDASLEDRLRAAVIGAGIGAGTAAAVRPRAVRAAEQWRYGFLADAYARLRDSLRFTLSPMFDLSRFTEGLMLSQTAVPLRRADGSRIALPVLSGGLSPVGAASPSGLRRSLARDARRAGKGKAEAKRFSEAEYERWVDEFDAAAKGRKDFDRDAIDSAGRWYRSAGIVGFSPTDWMATAYAHLRGEGFGMDEAYKAAREMYSYGSTGRSAAELSTNFVFFPFSFQKKALTHIGKWLNDDLGRSIILHDALKAYEHLDERYDLDRRWKDHIPYLQQLQRLNLFAYGISPGRFGGINSQLFEAVGKVGWNAFVPVGAKIQDASVGKELQDLGRQLTPVWNDINWMLHETSEVLLPNVAGIVTPMESASYRAQVRDGWAQYNQVRDDYEAALAEKGYTLSDLHSKPWLADALADYEGRIAEIAERYPAWFDSRTEIPGNAIALSMEKDLYMQRAAIARARGEEPSVDVRQMFEMQQFIDQTLDDLQLVHGTRDPQFAPPQLFQVVRDRAVEYAERNPRFRDLWNRFWRRDWGLIDEPMELP